MEDWVQVSNTQNPETLLLRRGILLCYLQLQISSVPTSGTWILLIVEIDGNLLLPTPTPYVSHTCLWTRVIVRIHSDLPLE